MGVPEPLSRRDRRAARYLEQLKARVLADRRVPARGPTAATQYAWALIVAALLGDEERQLFRDVYAAYTEGECLYQLRTACACENKDQLCLILDHLMVDTNGTQLLSAYLMEIIDTESWRAVRQELEARGLTAENFVWWTFDAERFS